MKRKLMVALIFALSSTAASAQGPGPWDIGPQFFKCETNPNLWHAIASGHWPFHCD
jgi:hypothetical protein